MLPLTRFRKRTRFFGISGPSFALDFVNGGALDPRITFTRASSATFFDSAGVLQSAAINVPRLDYAPATLAARGLLIEEQRTNSIRNNTMQGAVAGTPGTNPTNWVAGVTADGLTKEIVGTGTQNGITYVDIRWSGTSGAAATTTLFQCETQTQVTALNAQTWSGSMWVALVGGTLNNVNTLELRIRYNDGTGSILTQAGVTVATATSTMQRFSTAQTASNASTAFVNVGVIADFVNSSSVDFTLRIGLPQLEQGAFATSVIPTTTTALTRSADVASVNTLSPWYRADEGTLYGEAQTIALPITNAQSVGSLEDAVGTERIQIRAVASPLGWNGIVVDGVSQASLNSNVVLTTAKMALAYAVNDFKFCVNGAAPITDTLGTLPTPTALQLGRSVSTLNLNGWLRRLTYYPRRLSDAELQSITA